MQLGNLDCYRGCVFDAWAETITSLQLLHLHMSTHTVYMSIIIHDQGQSVTKVGTMSLDNGM